VEQAYRGWATVLVVLTVPVLLQFEFELAVARMVLGPDAEVLGGLLANSSGWLGASDETHCGKMATLKVHVGSGFRGSSPKPQTKP
jgi:hypothetical protein